MRRTFCEKSLSASLRVKLADKFVDGLAHGFSPRR
jgi:hypothetical protein